MLRHSDSDFAVIVIINARCRKVRLSSPHLFLFGGKSQEGRELFNCVEVIFHYALWWNHLLSVILEVMQMPGIFSTIYSFVEFFSLIDI